MKFLLDNLDYINSLPSWKYYCAEINCGKRITRKATRCFLHSRNSKNVIYKSEEFRSKMSKISIGRMKSKSTRRKISLSKIGKKRPKFSTLWIKNMSKAHSGRNNPMFGKPSPHGKWTVYKGIKFRSTYEANYAKFLDKNKIKWKYEYKTFDLGNTTYTPDFYLPLTNEYIEIKGYWRGDARGKYLKFRKRYPKIKIKVLNEKILKKMEVI